MTKPVRAPLITAVLVAGLSACGGSTRPDSDTWRRQWEAERDRIPTAQDFAAAGIEGCDELQGHFRTALPPLLPSPDDVLDDTVTEWIDRAERLAFDCPDDAEVIADEIAEIDTLSAEIEAGLDKR